MLRGDTAMLIRQAVVSDISAIAVLFNLCFYDSVIHHCGCIPKPQAMEDVFSLVYETEPAAAFVACDATGQVRGYCFAPTGLSGLWWRAVWHGHLVKWGWRWLTGQYGFGLYPVKILALNKLAFLRSSLAPAKAANARILSIAVHPAWQGQGLAGKLMAAADDYFAERQVERVRLEVRPANVPAIRVYEKYGFVRGGSTYDSQGEWLIMFKEMGEKSV